MPAPTPGLLAPPGRGAAAHSAPPHNPCRGRRLPWPSATGALRGLWEGWPGCKFFLDGGGCVAQIGGNR